MEKLFHRQEISRAPLTCETDEGLRDQVAHLIAEGETKAILPVEKEALNLRTNGEIRLGVIWA